MKSTDGKHYNIKVKLQEFVQKQGKVSRKEIIEFLDNNSDLSRDAKDNLILNISKSASWDIWSLTERGMYASREYVVEGDVAVKNYKHNIERAVNLAVKSITDELNKSLNPTELVESKDKADLFHGIIERLRDLTEFVSTDNK